VCRWGNEYSLYYTAVTKEGKGCIARASSKNLLDWTDQGPVFISHKLIHPESSNVQQLKSKYLLFFGGHYDWSYVVSDRPDSWLGCQPISLHPNITAMEVIAKNRSKWLVGFFKLEYYRLFLGVLNWAEKKPKIKEIEHATEIEEFLN